MHTLIAVVLVQASCSLPDGSPSSGASSKPPGEAPSCAANTPSRAFIGAGLGLIVLGADARGNTDVYVVDPISGETRRLTNDPAQDFDPTWSSDHAKIAFRSERDGDPEIYVMNADGTNQTNLTRSPGTDYSPAWSPDGAWIAFASDRAGGRNDIFVMRPDGSDTGRLTTSDTIDEYPSWSPDGRSIAFTDETNRSIWVMDSDGDNARLLATDAKLPDWSPDGALIAFSAGHARPEGIYTTNLDGSEIVPVTDVPGSGPAWACDGESIAFAWGGLSVVNVSQRTVQRVDLSGVDEVALPDW